MKEYTVLLLVPDTLAMTFGQDHYMAHITANDVRAAVCAATYEAMDSYDCWADGLDADSFYVVAVFEGKLIDVNPSAN